MNKTGILWIWIGLVIFLSPGTVSALSGFSDYQPLGIISGGFTLYPEVMTGMEFNDNIYATEDKTESDLIFTLAPRVKIRSNWSRHALNVDAGATFGFYTSETDESYFDGHLSLEGRLDIIRDSFVLGQVGIHHLHQERGSPDVNNAWDEPAVYCRTNADVSQYVGMGLFSLTYGLGITILDYQKVDLVAGGSDPLDDLTRDVYNFNALLAYEMHPEVQPFITTRYEWRRYDERAVRRDSEGIRIGIGSALYLGGVTSMEIFAGYMQQDYQYRSTISGFWTGLDLLWEPTELTSVAVGVQSSVEETILAASSGIRALDGKIEGDHKIRRNISLGVMAGYTHNDYMDIDRSNGYFSIGPRARYFLNRHLSADFSYTHKAKSNSGRDQSVEGYSQNRFNLSISGRL